MSAGAEEAVMTALGLLVVMENPLYIRPRVTAGDMDTDLDVTILGLRVP